MTVVVAVKSKGIVIQPRMANGSAVDTLRRFAHHVTIEPEYESDADPENGPALCGGSILNKNWILTSAYCVQNSIRLNIQLQRIHRNDTEGSFDISINNAENNVFVYPTESDDIALLKLPVDLLFSQTLKPIKVLETPLEKLNNKFAILPGFEIPAPHEGNETVNAAAPWDRLVFAMLGIVSNNECVVAYGSDVFDEYLSVCAKGWGNNRNAPCDSEHGSGLIVNWPSNPKLVGIFTRASQNCNSQSPSVYLNVQKYQSWIEGIVSSN